MCIRLFYQGTLATLRKDFVSCIPYFRIKTNFNSFYCKILLIIFNRGFFLRPAFRIYAVKTISYYSLFKESQATMISCDLNEYMYEFSIILQVISILYNKDLFFISVVYILYSSKSVDIDGFTPCLCTNQSNSEDARALEINAWLLYLVRCSLPCTDVLFCNYKVHVIITTKQTYKVWSYGHYRRNF